MRGSEPVGAPVTVNWGNPDAPGTAPVTPQTDPSVAAATYTYPRTGLYNIQVADASDNVSTSVQISGSGPVLTGLSPASIAENAGITTVTATGSSIPTDIQVLVDGQFVGFTRVSASQVDLVGDPRHLGVGKHTVVLREPNGSTSAGQTLTVTAPVGTRKRK